MKKILRRFEPYAILWGVGAAIFAALRLGPDDLVGVAFGTALALANWFVFNWAGRRVAALGDKGRFGFFLVVKTGSLLAVIWLILATEIASPLGMLLGLSALVFGLLARSTVQVLAEGNAALREER
ncbi:MAG: hypothetical protein M0R80_21230 [Proteobacteria bacterium]|jgi:hypothetical protein|nr:hypothetical protein [Pseudomonadota bacterium]